MTRVKRFCAVIALGLAVLAVRVGFVAGVFMAMGAPALSALFIAVVAEAALSVLEWAFEWAYDRAYSALEKRADRW